MSDLLESLWLLLADLLIPAYSVRLECVPAQPDQRASW